MVKKTDLAKKVKEFNKKVLCHMPSKKKIRAYKKQQQINRRGYREILEGEYEKIDITVAQDMEVRSEQDSLGKTPERDMQKFFKE